MFQIIPFVSQPVKNCVYRAIRDPRFRFNLLWSIHSADEPNKSDPYTVSMIDWWLVPDTVRRAAERFFGI